MHHYLPLVELARVRENNKAASLILLSDASNSLLTHPVTLEIMTENSPCVFIVWALFNPLRRCGITTHQATGRSRLRVQRFKPVNLIFLWSILPATIWALSRTTTAAPLFGFSERGAALRPVCENVMKTGTGLITIILALFPSAPLSARGFLL